MDWNEIFYYDETSPSCLRWKHDKFTGKDSRIKIVAAGDAAGCQCSRTSRYRVGCKQSEIKRLMVHRVIWEMFYGPIEGNLVIDHLDGNAGNNLISNLRLIDKSFNSRNCRISKNNKSGCSGVSIGKSTYKGTTYFTYYVNWKSLRGKLKAKTFSWLRYGKEEAFRLACEYRSKMVEELNKQGAGYTERHGKAST